MAAIGKVAAVFTASTSGLTSGINAAANAFRGLGGDAGALTSSLSKIQNISFASLQTAGPAAAAAADAFASIVSSAEALRQALENGAITAEKFRDLMASLTQEASKQSQIFSAGAATTAQFATAEERFAASTASLREQLAAGAISTETFGRAMESARTTLSEADGSAAASRAAMDSLNETMRRGVAVTNANMNAQERYGAELSDLRGLLAAGAISQQTFDRAAASASATLKKAEGASREAASGFDALASRLNVLIGIEVAKFFASVVSAVSGLLSLGAAATSSISAAVAEATSLGEETSKSAVIFGDAAAEIQKFADNSAAIGLSRQAALQATGSFGNLFAAMGLGSAQAAEYAQTMTALGADLASFNNATVEESVQAIGAALRGEAEPIRRFGVLLDEATLKQAALSAGLISSTSSSLTPAIKAQAAYAAILQQTTKAQGDFARTGDSLANLSRVIQAQTSNIFADIGSAFQPLYQSVASAASQVLGAVGPLVGQIAAGLESAVARISAAIQSLVPAFIQFVGTFDGANIGQAIGDALLLGARFLAGVGDFLIANLSNVWGYVSQVGEQWGGVAEFLSRSAGFLSMVFNGAQAGLGMIILGFTGAFEGLATIAQSIGQYLGFDTSTLDAVVAGAQAFNQTISDGISENVAQMQAGYDQAFGERSDSVGQAIAGPLVTALDASIAKADLAAAQVGEATSKPVEVKQSVEVNIDQALKGIDSRSQEGIAEMFRIMRGGAGDVQEQQLAVLEQIAVNTSGGDDISVMDY